MLGLSALLYMGASLNKTSTGLVEPGLAVLGAVVSALGVVLRVRWVRAGNRGRWRVPKNLRSGLG